MLPDATRNFVSSILTSDLKWLRRKLRREIKQEMWSRRGEIGNCRLQTQIIPEVPVVPENIEKFFEYILEER